MRGLGRPDRSAAIDPEDYYDFQVNRPTCRARRGRPPRGSPGRPPGSRSPRRPDLDRDVVLVRGIEPNMRWRSFCAELLGLADELGVELVVTLGALLADTPHTRPIPVTGTADRARRWSTGSSSSSRATRARPASSACFQDACARLGRPGRVALGGRAALRRAAAVPQGHAGAAAPGRGPARRHRPARRPARGGPGLGARRRRAGRGGRRGRRLRPRRSRRPRDTTDLPEASGEAIAREFERYLRRRRGRRPGRRS